MRILFPILLLICFSVDSTAATIRGTVLSWWSTGLYTNSPLPISDAVCVTAGTSEGKWIGAVHANGSFTNFGVEVESKRWVLPDPIPTNVIFLSHGWIHGYGITSDSNVFDYGAAADPDQDAAANFLPSPYHWLSNPITPGLWTNVIQTSCGDAHSALVTADGRVNVRGTRTSVHSATNITNGVGLHSCWHGLGVLLNDGTVSYHGDDPNPYTYDEVPANATNGMRLGGGMEFFCLVQSNGTVVAWGRNDNGQTDVPAGLSNIVDVSGGREYAVALLSDGSVTAWGGNASWQTNLPAGATNVYSLEAGFDSIMFLKNVGTNYYVATNGNDSNPGTYDEPFLTVQHAVDTALAGDTIMIGPGDYPEDVQTGNDGTTGNRIVIDGQGSAVVYSFVIQNEYITINNLNIPGRDTNRCILLDHGAHYFVLSNSVLDHEFTNAAGSMLGWDLPEVGHLPFGTNCASGALIVSNVFKNSTGGRCILMYGDTNTVYGNTFLDVDAGDWLRIWGRTNLISRNVFSNMFVSGASGEHPDWLQSFDDNGHGADGIVCEYNTVIKMDDESQLTMLSTEADCDYNGNFTFRNNIFVGIAHAGYNNTRDVRWFNNIFYKCSTNQGPVMYSYTNGHGARVVNNAFINCGTGLTNSAYGWYSIYGDIGLSNCQADFNFISISNIGLAPALDSEERYVGDPGGWSRFSWWEMNGIPGGLSYLSDPENYDFRPSTNSPVLGAGTNLTGWVDYDFYGNPITNWSIGPFQAAYDAAEPPPTTNIVRQTWSGRQSWGGKVVFQ